VTRPFLLLLTLAGCATVPSPAPPVAVAPPIVILVSLDGFHPDYLARGVTPSLDSLARVGVRAEWMTPSFPTKTFPNHYTLVTGLIPDHHGIVANNMWDDTLGRFTMARRDAVQDARWWGGEPLWVTAERQGIRTAPMFWPGSEAPIGGAMPAIWMRYDGDVPLATRVDSLLAWLTLPDSLRPRFLTLYASDVDHWGHQRGPAAPEVDTALARVDSMIGRLGAGLAARGLSGQVNVIVVSDHGMSATSPERLIALDDYIAMDDVTVVDWTPVGAVTPKPGRLDAVYAALRGAHPHLHVYRRGEVPAQYRFGTHPRVTDLVLIADDGWTITTRDRFASFRAGGTHGYDQTLPSMRALFLAAGPAFRQGATVPAFSNIHVYALMADILGVRPSPNDGSLDSVRMMLRR
jgi:predicted AlkP superfamily pyrophosphatase or phosphodiesterase